MRLPAARLLILLFPLLVLLTLLVLFTLRRPLLALGATHLTFGRWERERRQVGRLGLELLLAGHHAVLLQEERRQVGIGLVTEAPWPVLRHSRTHVVEKFSSAPALPVTQEVRPCDRRVGGTAQEIVSVAHGAMFEVLLGTCLGLGFGKAQLLTLLLLTLLTLLALLLARLLLLLALLLLALLLLAGLLHLLLCLSRLALLYLDGKGEWYGIGGDGYLDANIVASLLHLHPLLALLLTLLTRLLLTLLLTLRLTLLLLTRLLLTLLA